MIDFGIVKPGTTLYIPFATYDSNDPTASVTMTGFAVTDIEIYKDGGTTQRASDSGYALLDTDGIDFDGVTGIHGFSVDLADNTTAGFYAAGSQYFIVVSTITVDAGTISFIAARFKIGHPAAMWNTTIATLASQTSFTLTKGPADDDALNGCVACIHDVASEVQFGFAVVSDYTGSTKTVTLTAGTTFTAAATDNISFFPPANTRWTASVADNAQTGDSYAIVNSGTYGASVTKTAVDAIKTKTDYLPSATAGAAGGVFIAGTNASLTITGALTVSDGIAVACSTGGRSAIKATGNGAGHGLELIGGSTNGDGLIATGGATNGRGIAAIGTGSGDGLYAKGGATGDGIQGLGGSSSGHGMHLSQVGTTGSGIEIETANNSDGIKITAKGTGHGVFVTSGDGATGDGIRLIAASTNGNGLYAQGFGNGDGISGKGGATGDGIQGTGGTNGVGLHASGLGTGAGFKVDSVSGDGLNINAATSGHGVAITCTGSSKHGITVTGGNAGTSDGIKAIAGTGGVPIRGDITGNITGNLSGTVAWNAAWDAEVQSEVIDALQTAITEMTQGIPPATPTMQEAVMYLYMAWRNKTETTATLLKVHNDAGTAIAKATLSDDATTFTKAEFVSGA